MKLNEIEQPSEKKLLESASNDSGILVEDLTRVIRAKESTWTEHTPEEFEAHTRKLLGENF